MYNKLQTLIKQTHSESNTQCKYSRLSLMRTPHDRPHLCVLTGISVRIRESSLYIQMTPVNGIILYLLSFNKHNTINIIIVVANTFDCILAKDVFSPVFCFLSYAIEFLSTIQRLPQLIQVLIAGRADSLSIASIQLDIFAYTKAVSYGYLNHLSLFVYGEMIMHLAQSVALFLLV